jgi:hypothetical protein
MRCCFLRSLRRLRLRSSSSAVVAPPAAAAAAAAAADEEEKEDVTNSSKEGMMGREVAAAKFGAGAGNKGAATAATGEFEPDVGIIGVGFEADEGATVAEEATAAPAGGGGGGDDNGRG